MKIVIGLIFLLGGFALIFWLAFYVMLYGGIMQAVNSWGVSNEAVVWGIIRAVFFELGCIPGALVTALGMGALQN